MYLPIKIYTTPESLLIFQLSIPLWLSQRWGWKMRGPIHKDRWFAPQIKFGLADDVECLHMYIIGIRIRIRSFSKTRELRQQSNNIQRVIFNRWAGWQQLFQ